MDNDPKFVLHPFPLSNNVGQNDNLIELLWKNGHVVFHNQTYCISPSTNSESKPQKTEYTLKKGGSFGSSMNLIQADETASWFPNPLDDSVESNLHEEFFGIQIPDPNVIDKENIGEMCVKLGSSKDTNDCMESSLPQNSMMLPMNSQVYNSSNHSPSFENGIYLNFPHQTNPGREEVGATASNFGGVAIESSSHYQNNSTNTVVMENSMLSLSKNSPQEMAFDPIISSSSCGSGSSLGKVRQHVMINYDHKRKGRDAEEDEHHIKNDEEVPLEANKHAQKVAPLRKTRAAEVHNLSERRRRDKINEKMKALQDLIPHCNKPDKASMLDEAIEYLKSLQLQVQIMWMGGGMSPMVFPGVQQYMPCTGDGIIHPPLHSIPNPVQFPGTALCNQFMPPISTSNRPFICPSPGITPLNFPTQMPNVRLPGPFSHYFGFPFMNMPTQVMDMYTYGPQVTQHNQTAAAVASNRMPSLGTSSENIQNG